MGLTPRDQGRERDRRILDLVDRLGYARPDHVARVLCGGRVVVARRRLLRLMKEGLLARLAPGRNEAYVYHLPNRHPGGASLNHTLACADVYAALAATQGAGRLIQAWHPEYQLEGYRADALLLATLCGVRAAVFLEVDLATERTSVVDAKLGALAQLRDAGAHRGSAWWQPGTHVALLVVAPAERAEHLRPVLAKCAERLHLGVAVVDLAKVTTRPWAALEGLLKVASSQTTQREPPPAAITTAPPRARYYAPAGHHRTAVSTVAGAASSPQELSR